MAELNFEKDREIDPDELDVEWIAQPQLVYAYKREVVIAEKERDEIWENLKVIKSRLIKEVKQNTSKITGPEIEAYYRTHKDHKEAKQDLIDANYDLSMAENAFWAIQNRKSALENLVQLLTMDYFSSPVDPRNLSEIMKKKREEREKNIVKKIRKRKPRRKK